MTRISLVIQRISKKKSCQQQLHCLVKLFQILIHEILLYRCYIESMLTFSILCWLQHTVEKRTEHWDWSRGKAVWVEQCTRTDLCYKRWGGLTLPLLILTHTQRFSLYLQALGSDFCSWRVNRCNNSFISKTISFLNSTGAEGVRHNLKVICENNYFHISLTFISMLMLSGIKQFFLHPNLTQVNRLFVGTLHHPLDFFMCFMYVCLQVCDLCVFSTSWNTNCSMGTQ